MTSHANCNCNCKCSVSKCLYWLRHGCSESISVNVPFGHWLRHGCSDSISVNAPLRMAQVFISGWRHDMEMFSHYWPFVRGIHQSLVDSPHKGLVMWSFDVFFLVSLNKLLTYQSNCQWALCYFETLDECVSFHTCWSWSLSMNDLVINSKLASDFHHDLTHRSVVATDLGPHDNNILSCLSLLKCLFWAARCHEDVFLGV